jgi:sRNA-binding protein
MTYLLSRDEVEDFIEQLEQKYPKAFFSDPRQRLPLKKTIRADLEQDGFGATAEEINRVMEWYENHKGYQMQLIAGAKRFDLSGKAVSTVTAAEEQVAKRELVKINTKMRERREAREVQPVPKLDAQVKRVNVGTLPASMVRPVNGGATVEKVTLDALQVTVQKAVEAERLFADNPAMSRAVTVAILETVTREAQTLISKLKENVT